jgi:hypothetical protein
MKGENEVARDLPYELGLLKRIENVSVDGVQISEYPLFGKYSYWHRFVQFVFSSDIRRFSATRSFAGYQAGEGGRSVHVSLKGFIVSGFGIAMTSVGWIFARMARPQVIVFGIDRMSDVEHSADFRIRGLHAFLQKNKISFIECFHTVFNISFLKNIFLRGRFALYLESLDARFALMRRLGIAPKRHDPELKGLEAFSEEERKFVSYVVKKYIGEQALIEYRVKKLSRFIHDSGAKAIWMIDDARYYHDVALAAKVEGIPSYAFQHGHFTPYHVGWLKEPKTSLEYPRPDTLVVWSDYWKKELLRLGGVFPDNALAVGGYTEHAFSFTTEPAKNLTLLIPHETDSPKEEVRAHIESVLQALPDVEVYIKLRPDHSRDVQVSLYGAISAHTRVHFVSDVRELTVRPSAVLGVYSSFLYDMVRSKVPVAIMETSMDYGKGMVENGLADVLPKNDPKAIERISATALDVLKQRAQSLNSEAVFSDTLSDIAHSCGIATLKTVG